MNLHIQLSLQDFWRSFEWGNKKGGSIFSKRHNSEYRPFQKTKSFFPRYDFCPLSDLLRVWSEVEWCGLEPFPTDDHTIGRWWIPRELQVFAHPRKYSRAIGAAGPRMPFFLGNCYLTEITKVGETQAVKPCRQRSVEKRRVKSAWKVEKQLSTNLV